MKPASTSHRLIWILVIPGLIFTCRQESELPELKLSGPTLLYILREGECVSCVTRLKLFTEKMSSGENHLDQALIIISPTKSDPRGFGLDLGLPTYFARSPAFLKNTGTAAFLPMMYLVNTKNEIIFARPASFIGHDLDYLKEEILQLRFEFGEP